MIIIDPDKIILRLKREENKTQVFDPARKKWVVLTPEEHVRQTMLQYMIGELHYPLSLISVEKTIQVGGMSKRFDIVVYDRNHKPWLLAECKAPDVPVCERTLHQLLNYQNIMQCTFWLLTNGHQVYCADAADKEKIKWMDSMPLLGV